MFLRLFFSAAVPSPFLEILQYLLTMSFSVDKWGAGEEERGLELS